MFCGACGEENPPEMKFCKKCGGGLLTATRSSSEAESLPEKKKSANTVIIVIACVAAALFFFIFIGAILAAILVPNFIKARAQSQFASCEANLKNMATALEMWSSDHSGNYPENLGELIPSYLRAVPVCPAANSPTYVYKVTARDKSEKPSGFEIYCHGHWHRAVNISEDHPSYSSKTGFDAGRIYRYPRGSYRHY